MAGLAAFRGAGHCRYRTMRAGCQPRSGALEGRRVQDVLLLLFQQFHSLESVLVEEIKFPISISEQFTNHDDANSLLTREYRSGFAVPKIG